MGPMLSLTDQQLQTVTNAARDVPTEKRAQYLERVAAMLAMRRPFADADVVDVVALASRGLIQQPAA